MHQNETETFIYRNPQRRPDPEPLRHARHGGRGDDGGAMPKTSTSTIDKNQKGSITIYKRALDSSGNAGTAGDGETMVSPQGQH